MLKNAKKVFELLDEKEKNKSFIFFVLLLFATILEGLSIAIIYPVINAVLNDSGASFIKDFFTFIDFDFISTQYKTVFFLSLIVVLYAMKSAYLIFFSWWKSRFIYQLNNNIAKKLYSKYLYSELPFFLYKNSADFIRNIFTEARYLNVSIDGYLKFLVELFAIIIIIVALFIIDTKSTFITLGIFLAVALMFNKAYSKRIKKWGYAKQFHFSSILKTLQQSFGSIKEILIRGNQRYFQSQFQTNTESANQVGRNLMFISEIPKNVLEFLAVIFICVLFTFLFEGASNINNIIATIGVFGAAALRIIPGFNRLITGKQTIDSCVASVDILHKELIDKKTKNINLSKNQLNYDPVSFNNEIELKNVYFKYPQSKDYTLKNLNLKIKKNDIICLVGKSGIGKTTLVDLIAGLISPSEGSLKVDGKEILSSNYGWKKLIGYVPQDVYLNDDSIKNNIIFGFEENSINQENFDKAIKYAQLESLIKDLPKGIDHKVGENGSNLSGGQKQRIGIARSLYMNPKILICDEITSSLDENTSKDLLRCLNELSNKITIIYISHNNEIINSATKIYKFINDANKETILTQL